MGWMSDIYCPGCGANADEAGYEELEGHFSTGFYIFKTECCGALVQDGEWLSYAEARDKFYE